MAINSNRSVIEGIVVFYSDYSPFSGDCFPQNNEVVLSLATLAEGKQRISAFLGTNFLKIKTWESTKNELTPFQTAHF